MSLKKLVQVERGRITLRVFKNSESGILLFSADQTEKERQIWGPLLTESEVRCLGKLVDEQRARFVGKFRTLERPNDESEPDRVRKPSYDLDRAEVEIEEAMRQAREAEPSPITVIPSLPEYRYLHTCEICGCHVESRLLLFGGGSLKVCANCDHVHSGPE